LFASQKEAAMSALRRISTKKLLAIVSLAAVLVIGGAAIAMAMGGSGPKPAPKPLAKAVSDALNAPQVPGISARMKFTNNLVDASSIQGTDPLLSGAGGRLWASPEGGGKLRLELQSEGGGGDTQVLVSDHHFSIYDGTSETVYEGTLPEEEDKGEQAGEVPGLGAIEKEITKAEDHAELSGATPSDTAGQPTYTLRVAPKKDGGLLGGVEIAWDAENGIPLRAAIYSSASSSPVIQLEATDVAFESVPASTFEISPPAGAKVVNLSPVEDKGAGNGEPNQLEGLAAVQGSVDFPLDAPATLAGLPRADVSGIEVEGKTAALATYGKGLGGIAVIESKAEPGEGGESAESSEGLSLPKVSINGVQGEELDTALGTVLKFSRGGVDYIVVGSVPPAAAEAAARAL
jgi:outer membrane lipoprotein-sorting protein